MKDIDMDPAKDPEYIGGAVMLILFAIGAIGVIGGLIVGIAAGLGLISANLWHAFAAIICGLVLIVAVTIMVTNYSYATK